MSPSLDAYLHSTEKLPSNRAIGRKFGVDEATVRRRRKKLQETSKLVLSGSESELNFSGLIAENPLDPADVGAFAKIFELANLDPEEHELDRDSFRFSTWQQSKADSGGRRDLVQLYSYRGTFRRITPNKIPAKVLNQWKRSLKRSSFPEPRRNPQGQEGGTYVILVADPQLGKPGTAGAVENWRRGVNKHLEEARKQNVDQIHIAYMGDEIEAVADNYTNQVHVIELNQSEQLELDFDMRVWTMKQALGCGVPVSASSVISNHGEWTRKGSKDPVTTRSDNASTHIARQVKRLFEELEEFGVPPIEWTIGGKHPGLEIVLSGVPCYFSHGYVEKGRGGNVEARMKSAIERQILGRTEDLGTTKLWFMAHYHHLYSQEFEGRTLFGCPALETQQSSEYMLDQYGVWSPPGMLGMIVSDLTDRGWRNQNVW